METKKIGRIFKGTVDDKFIFSASLIKTNGTVISSYHTKVDSSLIVLVARESFSAKRRRSTIFPILGKFLFSVSKYQKLQVGISLIDSDKYIQLIASPLCPFTKLYNRLVQLSEKVDRILAKEQKT